MAEGGGGEKACGSTPTVFVSYASQDAAVANSVVEALEQHNIGCWIAPRDVTPGASYAGQIIHAIDATKAGVLILSRDAASSPHVLREVERAASKRHPIIALRIDQAPLPPDFEYFLNSSHWLDASTGDVGGALPKLIAAVQVAIHAPAATHADALTEHAPARALSARSPKWTVIIVASVVGLGLVALAADRLWLSRHPSAATPPATPARVEPVPAPAAPTIPEKSVAVLPFLDMSEQKDQEYLADGMAEEILNLLARVPNLSVIGRTSSFQFKAKNEDLRAIGAKLNAAYVLEGSVRKSANRVRVTAQLINTRTGVHQWSNTYDRDMGDVLKLQDDIAGAVSQALRIVLTAPLPARPSLKSSEAYRMYLEGRFFSETGNEADSDRAISAYRDALALEPQYSPAWAALSNQLQSQADMFGADARTMYQSAREAAQHAIELDPAAIDGYLAMANVFISFDWDWARAAQAIETARRFQPDSGRVLGFAGSLATILGHWDKAIGYARQAVARDPLSAGSRETLAYPLYCKGQFAESEAEIRTALQLAPEGAVTYTMLSRTLMLQGRLSEALTAARKDPNQEFRLWALAMIFHAMDRKAESDAALAELKRVRPTGDEDGIAWIYAARGELDSGFAWFDRAYTQRDNALIYIKCMPEAPKFKRDPRYKELLRKMNLPE
jgi:adenylate cyclase